MGIYCKSILTIQRVSMRMKRINFHEWKAARNFPTTEFYAVQMHVNTLRRHSISIQGNGKTLFTIWPFKCKWVGKTIRKRGRKKKMLRKSTEIAFIFVSISLSPAPNFFFFCMHCKYRIIRVFTEKGFGNGNRLRRQFLNVTLCEVIFKLLLTKNRNGKQTTNGNDYVH